MIKFIAQPFVSSHTNAIGVLDLRPELGHRPYSGFYCLKIRILKGLLIRPYPIRIPRNRHRRVDDQ